MRVFLPSLSLVALASAATSDVFDVIIVGSGPGGLVAAEYLTRDPTIKVLMLEAGEPSTKVSGGKDVPTYAGSTGWTKFDIPGEYTNVAFNSQSRYQPDWIASPKSYIAKTVGGCSSLNGMLYFHPSDAFVQETSWPNSVADVNAGFSEIEKSFSYTNNPSTDGKRYLQEAFNIISGALTSSGFSERNLNDNAARNSKSKTFGHPPLAIKDGFRDSPATTFLGKLNGRANFQLKTQSLVSHIIQRKGVASGVVYGAGVQADISARGVVVMAAGALSTPKVLIQSGIGPKTQLDLLKGKNGFPGVSNDSNAWLVNENVGASLFDTVQLLATFSNPAMATFNHANPPQSAKDQYMKDRSGPMTSPDPVIIAYENDQVNGHTYQFQLTGFCKAFEGDSRNNFGVAVYLNNPKSRDTCAFSSDLKWRCDTQHTGYLSHPDDATALGKYMEKVVKMFNTNGTSMVAPAAKANVQDWTHQKKDGTNHYGGSCYTSGDASDTKRCSDEKFRVVGAANVFVADASLQKEGTVNPYGWTMYAGYQAGVNIKAKLSDSKPTNKRSSETNDEDSEPIVRIHARHASP